MDGEGCCIEKAHRPGLGEDSAIMVDKEEIRRLYQREVKALMGMQFCVIERQCESFVCCAHEWIDPETVRLYRVLYSIISLDTRGEMKSPTLAVIWPATPSSYPKCPKILKIGMDILECILRLI